MGKSKENRFMAEKLLFKKRVLTKKDMRETVYLNCSSSTPTSDNPGILRLRCLGMTNVFPQRDHTIPYERKKKKENITGKNKKNNRDDGLLIFSIAKCPCTAWWKGGHKRTFPAGKIFFASPGNHTGLCIHNNTQEENIRYYLIVERNVNIELLFNLSETAIFDASDPQRVMACVESLFEMVSNPSSYTERDLSVKFFEFLSFLIIPNCPGVNFSGRYKDLFQLVAGYPVNYPTIDSLKKLFQLSEKTLIKVFHEYTGKAPMQFVIYMRLYNSCWQLTDTNMPVGEIATLAGYPDVAFYSKAFKKTFGISPANYRKNSCLQK